MSLTSDTSGRSLLIAGCGDGSVRLFDRRLAPAEWWVWFYIANISYIFLYSELRYFSTWMKTCLLNTLCLLMLVIFYANSNLTVNLAVRSLRLFTSCLEHISVIFISKICCVDVSGVCIVSHTFWGSVTLTSGLSFRIILFGAYLLHVYYLR